MVEHADGGVVSDVDVTVNPSEELLAKVEANLKALEDDPGVKDEKGERKILQDTEDSAVSAVESAISSVTSVTESVVSEAVSAADSAVSAAVADGKNYDIEDNLIRAAVHQGWDDKQIKDFMQLDPDRARATFQKMYESVNKLSQQFADIGRKQLEQDAQEQKPETKPTKKDDKKPEFKKIDIGELKKQYDNDPIVDLVGQQQEQNEALFNMVQDLRETISTRPQDTSRQQVELGTEAAAVVKQVDTFFKQDDMKLYDDFYGSGDNLTPGQAANVNAVLELADQIRAGRTLQGLDTTVDEALIQAHMLVSEPVREKMVRTNIVSALKKRSKGISLKPGSKGRDVNAVEHTKPTTPEQVIENAQARLNKVFG